MSYQALYRKWRPSTFEEMVGQDAVTKTLQNQIRADRIGHAYLFCGTRGTGKTSAAKIFARAVNCPNAAENGGSPCNHCEVCESILSGRAMNVMEIDAASNNGVDNIRDIREQVEYPPVTGRYKVYIIDEVHMLSPGAFNALLKTLEEPPAYVIFILATTDPQKIPQTILSRCQRYDFRRMSRRTAAEQLRKITQQEGLQIEDKALYYIAEAGDGSMRDALSLLDQCASYHLGEMLTYDHVLEILGAADVTVFSQLYRQILEGRIEDALSTVGELINSGADVLQLINDFIWYLRNVLLAGSGASEDALEISEEKYRMAREDAALASRSRLVEIMSSLAELVNRARFSPQKRVLLEVELIRLCTLDRTGAGREPAVKVNTEDRVPWRADAGPAASVPAGPEAHADTVGISADPAVDTGNPLPLSPKLKISLIDGPQEQDREQSTKQPAAAPAGSADRLKSIRSHWDELVAELSPSNRPLFHGVVIREEKDGLMLLFRNKINYTLAARNTEENGLLKLKDLVEARLGFRVAFKARIARPGEMDEEDNRATDEELKRINFPVDIET